MTGPGIPVTLEGVTGRAKRPPREAPTAMDHLDPAPDPVPAPEPERPPSIEEGVLLDLEAFPEKMREGAIARTALLLARQLDAMWPAMSPRDVASYVQRIGVAVTQLREMSPGEAKGDSTDGAREARETRLLRVVE
jgi:hypothetical protein